MNIVRLAAALATFTFTVTIVLGPTVPPAARAADAPDKKPASRPVAPRVTTEAGTARALERTLPEVRFDAVDLSAVFDFMRDVSGLNIVADWKRLEPAGAKRNKPISESAQDTKVADLLTRIINKAADPKHPVKWSNTGGVVLISTPAGLEAYAAAGKEVAPDKLDERSRTVFDRTMPEVRFEDVALGDVIDFMKDVSGIPMNVDWKALETAGVDRNAKVNLRLSDIAFGQAMRLILMSVTDQTPLRFSARDGKVQITADAPKK